MQYMFKKPRLIVDWDTVDKHHDPHILTQELFFNVAFAVIFGSLRTQFVSGALDDYTFLREFLLIWSLVNNAADYATRFNDDDAFHTMMWGVYGAGLVGTLMHIHNQIHYSIALTQIWLSIAWFRVAGWLPRCRVFAIPEGICLLVTGISIIYVGWHKLQYTWIGLMPIFLQPIFICLIAAFLPLRYRMPFNIEYHKPKFQGMAMVVLGQLVIVAATPPASGEGPDDEVGFYRNAIATVVILVFFKLIMTDCDITLHENHAIARSKTTRILWILLVQPALNFSIVACSAGIMFLHNSTNHGVHDDVDRGNRIIGYSGAGMFASVLASQMLHSREKVLKECAAVRRLKNFWLSLLAACVVVCVLVPEFPTEPLPVLAVLNAVAAKVGWVTKSRVLMMRNAQGNAHVGNFINHLKTARMKRHGTIDLEAGGVDLAAQDSLES